MNKQCSIFHLPSVMLVAALIVCCGCSTIVEIPKVIFGFSIKHLEDARADALSETFQCAFDDCFDAILKLEHMTDKDAFGDIKRSGVFDVYMKNRIHAYIVVMGIEGNINTTEVGIFLVKKGLNLYKIEISSLSTSAKEKIANAVFSALAQQFSTGG